ncbi:MAG: DUF1858 domain-containing protein, partial [Planctomycetota bacterium]
MSDLPITPETKVAHLLDAYPDLEAVLIELAPAFERLRNPILRRTVARLTTLERAAGIAGLDARTLVRRLREAAGQPLPEDDAPAARAAGRPEAPPPPTATRGAPRPVWIGDRDPTATIDAGRLLDESEAPLPH